jgi:hypothetical protein
MNSLRGPPWILASITYLALSGIVIAQRADENAVTAAEDAFGTAIGLQNVGLYSPEDARGFSPQQAGNLRIERLYFDQQTWVITDCMVSETTMRVGARASSRPPRSRSIQPPGVGELQNHEVLDIGHERCAVHQRVSHRV